MPYIYLLCAMCCSAMLSIMSSAFGKQNPRFKNAATLYSFIVAISAFAAWGLIFISDAEFNKGVLIYSLLYGLFYTMAIIGMFKAYSAGSVSLTAFVKQLSLIGVAVWGFIFWETVITAYILIGISLIVVALYLCFRQNKTLKQKSVSAKWLLFALMLLIGNAGCSIIQKYQQMAFNGRYGSQLMFFGAGFSVVACAVLYFKGEHLKLRQLSKKYSIIYPIAGGISSAVLNLFILLLISTSLPESVIFPGIAVGGLIITTLFSVTVYKEKLYYYQWVGLGIGAVALIFLNI